MTPPTCLPTATYTYWSAKPIPENPTRIHNTVPFVYPRLIYPTEARAIEATSYALIVYLRNNLFTESKPIMKWLQTMRNYISGFSATRVSAILYTLLFFYLVITNSWLLISMHLKTCAAKLFFFFLSSKYIFSKKPAISDIWIIQRETPFCTFLQRGVRNTPATLLKLLMIENGPYNSG